MFPTRCFARHGAFAAYKHKKTKGETNDADESRRRHKEAPSTPTVGIRAPPGLVLKGQTQAASDHGERKEEQRVPHIV